MTHLIAFLCLWTLAGLALAGCLFPRQRHDKCPPTEINFSWNSAETGWEGSAHYIWDAQDKTWQQTSKQSWQTEPAAP